MFILFTLKRRLWEFIGVYCYLREGYREDTMRFFLQVKILSGQEVMDMNQNVEKFNIKVKKTKQKQQHYVSG